MNAKYYITTLFCFLAVLLLGQEAQEYIGAGNDRGIKVRTSSNTLSSIGENTINGNGFDARKMEASRFLFQASFGAPMEEIEALSETLNYEAWINQQFDLPTTLLLPKLWEVNERSKRLFESERDDPNEDFFGPYALHFNYAWWDNNIRAQDMLRQRVAYALSQILVISINSQLGEFGEGLSSYYDILINNAFGNYEDLLQQVTLDPNMGFYLSHLNNFKADPDLGTKPDENYAREIMQLFSIGLYELNTDGSRKTDANGEWIPTYDNQDIQELAKVFTGLKGGAWSKEALTFPNISENTPVQFGVDIYGISREVPMQMHQVYHEQGPKTIIGDYTIPAGQPGLKDIEDAVHHIFMHPNVGPFVARRLIQQFVKSNPSPRYIEQVARAFNDNGQGVRGDMKAVIKAVLLDEEARTCEALQSATNGKLREPILRYTHLAHSIALDNPDGYYWNTGYDYLSDTKQMVLGAPSVFNFYTPDFQPTGEFSESNLMAPEYKIHDTQTAIGYLNQAHKWTDWNVLFWDWHSSTPHVETDFSDLMRLAPDPETLVNHLDVLLTHGRLSNETRSIILEAINEIPSSWDDFTLWRSRIAVYLFMISPDYVVLK